MRANYKKWKPTSAEKIAMNKAIMEELLKIDKSKATLCDALILLTYCRCIGTMSKYQCRVFWDEYEKLEDELQHYYSTLPAIIKDGELELNFYAQEELKRFGVDVAYWRERGSSWKPDNDECFKNAITSGRKPKKYKY